MRPGDNFEVTCTVQNPSIIAWFLSVSGDEPFEAVFFSKFSPLNEKYQIGPFSLTLVSVDPLTSTANLSSVGNDQIGIVLTCSNAPYPIPNETSHIVIHIEGKCLILLTGLYVYHNMHINISREQIPVCIFYILLYIPLLSNLL